MGKITASHLFFSIKKQARLDKNLIQRLISGVVYGLVIFLCTTYFGSYFLKSYLGISVPQEYLYFGLMIFLSAVGSWESAKIMKFGSGWWQWTIIPIFILLFYRFGMRFFHHGYFFNFNTSEFLGLSLIAIASFTLFKYPKELYYDNGKLIFTAVYAILTFCFALGLPSFNFSLEQPFGWEVFMLFVLIWSSDSFAYFAGRMFGKHKMAPTISPKKTWEGFAGGVICTLILGYFIEQKMPEMRGNWMVVGFLVSVFAPLGDLVESQLKRTFGVKDSGNIMPGHGGVLDRLDSFIICAPVVYLYFLLEKMI